MGFSIIRIAYFLCYLYIPWRINAGLEIKKPWNIRLFLIFIFAGIFNAFVYFGSRSGLSFPSALQAFGDISMGSVGIAVTLFVLNDIVNAVNLKFKIKKFGYYSTVVVICLSLLASVWAVLNFAFIIRVKEVNFKVLGLTKDSFTIVQLSDIHINRRTSPEMIKRIFEKAASLEPDIIVLTGDIIDIDINKDDKFLEYGFRELKAPYGVFAVTGNHERRRALAFYKMMNKLGIKTLRNESVLIDGIINVAGINDIDWKDAESIKAALAQAVPVYPVLFLSHRPETFDMAAGQGRDIVQLSGHTHAGQIPPIEIVRNFFMDYNYGIYKKGGSRMYVTSGTRAWGPPMRLFNFSEIAKITLENEKLEK